MKTTKKSLRILVIAIIAMISGNSLFAQFAPTATVNQTPIEERKGNTSTYTVPGPVGDEYRWEILGAASVPAATSGSGAAGDPFVVPFTAGQTTITVEWPADDNTIASVTGNVSVQRRVVGATTSCPSTVQSLDVILWSNPTISIQDADYEICSGDATLGDITVTLTGAPNFAFTYEIKMPDGSTTTSSITDVTSGTTTIPIEPNLINGSSTDDQTYVVTITEMYDAFTGLGTIVDGTFTITVHPTIETGDITSDNPLIRR